MFYTIIGVIRNQAKLSEKINKKEIRQAMRHPLSLKDIVMFKEYKGINLLFWIIGMMPTSMSFEAIRTIGKLKKII